MYNEFIENYILENGQWTVPEDGIYEMHHIIFACKGGEGDYFNKKTGKWSFKRKSTHINCVYLPPEIHYRAHKLAYLDNPDDADIARAWLMMAFPKGKTKRDAHGHSLPISEDDYRLLRIIAKKTDARQHLPAWNKGLTKETDERVAAYSSSLSKSKKGISRGPLSDETRLKMSDAAYKRYEEHPESFVSGTKDKVAINDGVKCTYICKEESLPDGYVYGQGKRNSYNIKDIDAYRELRSELASGSNNPMYGKGEKISGGKNGKADTIYFFEGIKYECRLDLYNALLEKGYDISISILRSICLGNYSKKTATKFKHIIDNLTSRKKNEN